MSEAHCDNCRFWKQHGTPSLSRLGFCRRRVPVVSISTVEASLWPETKHEDWCGEYEAKPPQAVPQPVPEPGTSPRLQQQPLDKPRLQQTMP